MKLKIAFEVKIFRKVEVIKMVDWEIKLIVQLIRFGLIIFGHFDFEFLEN